MRLPWQRSPKDELRYSLDDVITWLNSFTYNGNSYTVPAIQQTLAGEMEPSPQGFQGLAAQAFGGNGAVFACMAVRQLVFSAIRFQWQQMNAGRPAELFGNSALLSIERPWFGGTTQDLLSRMIQDADLSGNFYAVRDTPFPRIGGDTTTYEIVRLRPDWVMNARQARIIRGGHVGYQRLGIAYFEGGQGSGNTEPTVFQVGEFAHFAPYPDPLASWRGMSWLTPVVREIQSDGQMTTHKQKYFENGATPNLVIKYPANAREQDMKVVQKLFADRHTGVDNAYKTIHIGGGADITVVGANMDQINFKALQNAGETRIAAAAGIPPSIVGFGEGLSGSSLNEGNYGAARRRLADGTAAPMWANAAGSLAPLIATQTALGSDYARYTSGAIRLWYDARDVPFLREDETDEANIRQINAISIRQYIDAGFKPKSAVDAVSSGDLGRLQHSGLFSVQLQPPTTLSPDPNLNGATPAPVATPAVPATANGNGKPVPTTSGGT
jgi:phage portal protein BeeE